MSPSCFADCLLTCCEPQATSSSYHHHDSHNASTAIKPGSPSTAGSTIQQVCGSLNQHKPFCKLFGICLFWSKHTPAFRDRISLMHTKVLVSSTPYLLTPKAQPYNLLACIALHQTTTFTLSAVLLTFSGCMLDGACLELSINRLDDVTGTAGQASSDLTASHLQVTSPSSISTPSNTALMSLCICARPFKSVHAWA